MYMYTYLPEAGSDLLQCCLALNINIMHMDTPTNVAFIALKHVEADSTIIIYITSTVQIALELSTTLIIVLNYILLPAMPKNVITRY